MTPEADLLAGALRVLGEALLRPDAAAIETAARDAAAALQALERRPPSREVLEQLDELNRRNGALLAARREALQWAQSRLAPGTRLYGSDGQSAVASAPRRLATA